MNSKRKQQEYRKHVITDCGSNDNVAAPKALEPFARPQRKQGRQDPGESGTGQVTTVCLEKVYVFAKGPGCDKMGIVSFVEPLFFQKDWM